MKPITIIGGGLAGLTLGIGLRRNGIPVKVIEAGHYPRHRVCGEFISGRGQQVLGRLGLLTGLQCQGTIQAETAAFTIGNQRGPIRRLKQSAICISRFTLDNFLAQAFQELGGELHVNTRAGAGLPDEGTVHASGRRPVPVDNGWAWYGLKIHARAFPLIADLELHAFQNGYVGLCRLPDMEVNICGLFRKPTRHQNSEAHPASVVGGCNRFATEIPAATDLRDRFAAATLDEASFCSVAGLSLGPQKAAAITECCVGDALTMTPPVTGNGMSMAFESAELAIEPLSAYSKNECSWAAARMTIATACDERFTSRLRWAKWLQWMLFNQPFRNSLGTLALRSRRVWNILFRQTR